MVLRSPHGANFASLYLTLIVPIEPDQKLMHLPVLGHKLIVLGHKPMDKLVVLLVCRRHACEAFLLRDALSLCIVESVIHETLMQQWPIALVNEGQPGSHSAHQ